MEESQLATRVRRATAEDAAAISALLEDVQGLHATAHPAIFKPYSPATFPPETIRALMADPAHIFFLSEEAGEAVAHLYAEVQRRAETPFHHAYAEIHVHQIAVKPAFQRRGHGERLIGAAKALMQAHGISMLTLNTWAFNKRAQAFFAKQGFEPMMHRLWLRDVSVEMDAPHAGTND